MTFDQFSLYCPSMKTKPKPRFAFLLLLSLIFLSPFCYAQKLGLEPEKWAFKLANNKLTEENSMGGLNMLLEEADSARAFGFIDSLENVGKEKGYYFRLYFNMVKAKYLYDKFAGIDKFKDRRAKELEPRKAQIMQLHFDAIEAAYHTEDELAIGWASFYSAVIMGKFGETGLAVMYSKNGVDIFEKEGYPVEPTVYTILSELLYEVREYDESMANAKKAVKAWPTNSDTSFKNQKKAQQYQIRNRNILALNFFIQKNDDSAIAHFEKAGQIARALQDTLWTGKILGNIGRVLYNQDQFDSAYQLFKRDYDCSKSVNVYDNAASAAEWAAKANLALGNTAAALAEARNAKELLTLWPNRPFLRDTYFSLAQIFRASKKYDSAFFYNDLYIALNDSLEKEVATSSLAISKAKLNDEISHFNIQKLNRQKKQEVFWRNIIIMAIIVFAIIALLIANRKLLTEKIKKQQVEKDKTLLEQNMQAANEQLLMFTTNIIEKTKMISELELQMSDKQSSAEHDATLSSLTQFTILTEDDWSKFKQLFEKAYPGFFRKLVDQFPDITLSEQRMAALCKLKLSTYEMAAMLGISNDSVRKSKQRLRQRIGLSNEISLEDFCAAL